MKRALVILPVLFVLVLAGLLIAPSFIDWNGYKDQIRAQIKDRTGIDSVLDGDISLVLIPSPRVLVENVVLKAPAGSKNETLVSFERFDLNLQLMPLMQGKIEVSSVTLVKPEIYLEISKEGKISALTPELEKMADGGGSSEEQKGQGTPDISIRNVSIKEGVFSFLDMQDGNEIRVENINLDLEAQSLQGPFMAEGSLFYQGRSVSLDISTDRISDGAKTVASKAQIRVMPEDLDLNFSGAIGFGENFSAQGQTEISVKNLSQFLAGDSPSLPLTAEGLLTSDGKSFKLDDFVAQLGDDKLSGSANVVSEPLAVQLKLKTQDELNLRDLTNGAVPFNAVLFDFDASGDQKKISLGKSIIKAEGKEYKISGDYLLPVKEGRAKIVAAIEAEEIDIDALSGKATGQKEATNGKAGNGLSGTELPIDLDISLAAGKILTDGHVLKNAKIVANIEGKALNVSEFFVADFAGAAISGGGKIADFVSLTGIDAYASIDAKESRAFLKSLNVDTTALPENLGSIKGKIKASGTLEALDVTTNIAAMNGEVIAQGKLDQVLEQPSVRDIALQVKHQNMAQAIQILTGASEQDKNFAKPMDVYTKIRQEGSVYILDGLKGNLGGASVAGSASLDLSGAKPYFKGDLKFGKIVLDAGLTKDGQAGSAAKGIKGSKKQSQTTKSGRWSSDEINTAGLNSLNADVALTAQQIVYGAYPLVAPSLSLSLQDGTLTISEMKAGLFEGSIALNSTVKTVPEPHQPIHVSAQASLKNVSLSHLVKALAGSEIIKTSGYASTDVAIKTSGVSPAALVYDLGGQGTVNGQDIILEGVDLTRFARALSDDTKPGDTVLGLWKGSTKGGSTSFKTLEGNYVISEGIVDIQKLDLDGDQSTIQTTGNVNLPQWTLATKHKILIKQVDGQPADIPPVEMSFSGSLDNPSQTFGQGLLNDYINRKVQRKLEGFIGDKLGFPSASKNNEASQTAPASGDEEPTEPQQQEQSQDPEDAAKDAIKGVLDGLLR